MSLATYPVPTLFPLGKRVPLGDSHWKRSNVQLRAFNTARPIQPVLRCHRIGYDSFQSRRSNGRANQMQSAAAICASAYRTRCAIAQVQTLPRKSASSTIAPPPGKDPPMVDNGGSGFTGTKDKPYYRGGGGGGDGNGVPRCGEFPWGDFWFYIFLMLLWFSVRNIIREGNCVYTYKDGRHKPITHFVGNAGHAEFEWKRLEEEHCKEFD